jgi:phosphoribosylamine--glycine ligase
MKVLLIDQGECGLALAYRAAIQGHLVFWYIEKKPATNQKTGTGMHENIIKIDTWVPYTTQVDLIVTTENGGNYLKKLDVLRDKGVRVFAPSKECAELEINREHGIKFLKDHGIDVPESMNFKNIKEAQKYIEENPQPYVFKTLGDNDNKALTFVSKEPKQLIQQLKMWKEQGISIKGEVQLQKFIKGMEMACMRWVGRDGFIGPIQESFEHKKHYAGEKGVNTGEMGTIGKYVNKSKLYDLVLKPLEKSLADIGCFTSIDINCIIDEDGKPWPLEFTARFGWPIFNMLLNAVKGDVIQWMYDACDGIDSLEVSMKTMIGVVLVIPPFPYENTGDYCVEGIPLYGLSEGMKLRIQPQSIMMGKYIEEVDGKFEEVDGWVSSGPYVGVVCTEGKDITEAQIKAYTIIDKISMSDMGYRIDIGTKVKKMLPELQKLGYATDWEIENDNSE